MNEDILKRRYQKKAAGLATCESYLEQQSLELFSVIKN